MKEVSAPPTTLIVNFSPPGFEFGRTTLEVIAIVVVGSVVIAWLALRGRSTRENSVVLAGLVGERGRVVSPLAPEGVVSIRGEHWKARTQEGLIGKDEEVEILSVSEGLVLIVAPRTKS